MPNLVIPSTINLRARHASDPRKAVGGRGAHSLRELPYMTSSEKGRGSRNTANWRTNSIDFADKERGGGVKKS